MFCPIAVFPPHFQCLLSFTLSSLVSLLNQEHFSPCHGRSTLGRSPRSAILQAWEEVPEQFAQVPAGQLSSQPTKVLSKVPSTVLLLFPQVLLLSLEEAVCCGGGGWLVMELEPPRHSSRELPPQISLFNVSSKQVVTPLEVNSWIFLPNTP